jgi:alpha-tubulin suppressor-like RCC1 family protein
MLGLGENFILYASSTGLLFAKGINDDGQLGLGNSNSSTVFNEVGIANKLTNEKFYTAYTGARHAGTISSSARLFTWGSNTYGQLGNNSTTNSNSPGLVSISGKPILLSMGHYHTLMLNSFNQVYAWGRNDLGQVGDSTLTNKLIPTLISFPNLVSSEKIVSIAAGENFSLGLTNFGKVYAWGSNDSGQLAASSALSRSILPRIVTLNGLAEGEVVEKIYAGYRNAYVITNQGRLFSWGNNGFGQLGLGSQINQNSPTEIILYESDSQVKWRKLSVGYNHVLGVSEEDKLYGWGSNINGQLKDTQLSSFYSPTRIAIN